MDGISPAATRALMVAAAFWTLVRFESSSDIVSCECAKMLVLGNCKEDDDGSRTV